VRGANLSAARATRRAPLAQRLHAVVLAGGAGERFWPRSRRRFPKPLLPVVDGVSLLEATCARARRFAPRERTWLVCGREHAAEMRAAAGLPASRVFVEPLRRNTALAVGVAAARIARRDPDAVLVVLAADHRIPDARAFAAAIRRAARAADRAQVLVTLGVRPTRPDVGYGYIQLGPPATGQMGLHHIRRFVEKPDAARARAFLRTGGFLWNAGIFVWSARAILEEIERCAPEVHAVLARLGTKGWSERGERAGRSVVAAYRAAPSLPIDVAVLEKSQRVWTLPVSFRWSDVGTWASLAEELGVGPDAGRCLGGDVVLEEAPGNLVWGSAGRTIALLGVEGLAVIDTPDALLVTKLERSPQVRAIVERLRAAGREDLL
jgi:mannose-1-phosphate guanylyltransferase/mannose-6-phosphate isomerase